MGGFRDGGWQFLTFGRWNSHFLIHTWTFLAIISIASQLFLCLFWISLWLGIGVYTTLASKNLCKIAQASKNSDSNAQYYLSDLLTHSWFHSMLFALPSYQFPYTVMNRCLYLSGVHLQQGHTTIWTCRCCGVWVMFYVFSSAACIIKSTSDMSWCGLLLMKINNGLIVFRTIHGNRHSSFFSSKMLVCTIEKLQNLDTKFKTCILNPCLILNLTTSPMCNHSSLMFYHYCSLLMS
jgi:hypothetical protein